MINNTPPRQDYIFIKGAKVHNLKNIDLYLPRNKLIVITGISGSGKSSLAFDTIYAEGQRRYVESLSAYARQFLDQAEKPDVEYIEGLSPAISIDQKGVPKNPRSTVGTITEIYDYLRVLFARIGSPHCPKCSQLINPQTMDQIIDQIMHYKQGSKLQILAPVVMGRKGEYKKLLDDIKKAGFVRVRINKEILSLDEKIELHKYKQHNIEVVVDRLILKEDIRGRLADSLETTLKLGKGLAIVLKEEDGKHEEIIFSQRYSCVNCGISLPEIHPRSFSFNSPYGACEACSGLGVKIEIDPDLIIYDKEKSIEDRGILPWNITTSNYYHQLIKTAAYEYGIDLNEPIKNLSKEAIEYLLYGDVADDPPLLTVYFRNRFGEKRVVNTYFDGIVNVLERKYHESDSDFLKEELEKYMRERTCSACNGARLKKEALSVKINGLSIADVCRLSISAAYQWFDNLKLTEREKVIADRLLKEIKARLQFLINVGLDYLTLDRSAHTLAGGEAQRIRLATQIGSGLMGVLYILDEPSVGLHQRDNRKLLTTLEALRDLGNTVIVVEHDETTIRIADHIVDLGPGAGEAGGYVVAQGSIEDIMQCEKSLTGKYLRRELRIPLPKQRRRPQNDYYLQIIGASQFNLKNINVKIPLGLFICVTGVSGSGKSTLVSEVLYKGLRHYLYGSREQPGKFEKIVGLEHIDKVIEIDQSPIGRTPRSNPATYTKAFDHIRQLFAQTPQARMRGYKPGRFSFNVRGGRCEKCEGDGQILIEMHFLPDVYITCDSCNGKRYNNETLQVRYKGKNIAEVLSMKVEEALEFFGNIPQLKRIIQTLYDVGLGYIELGQPATTLSGGEAQRVKLAAELSKRATGRTLYILDEPTTGLHFADIQKLLDVLNRLVDAGNTVIVIEHNLDVIKVADYIIDLGPEGGDKGGYVVVADTPEKVITCNNSYTGKFLKQVLEREKRIEKGAL